MKMVKLALFGLIFLAYSATPSAGNGVGDSTKIMSKLVGDLGNQMPGKKNEGTTKGVYVLQPTEIIGPETTAFDLLSPKVFDANPALFPGMTRLDFKGKYSICPATPACPDIYGKMPGATANSTEQAPALINNPNCPPICMVFRTVTPQPTASSPSQVGKTVTNPVFPTCPAGYVAGIAFNPDYDLFNNGTTAPAITPTSFKELDDLRKKGYTCALPTDSGRLNLGCISSVHLDNGVHTDPAQEARHRPIDFTTRLDKFTNNLDIIFDNPKATIKAIGQFNFSTNTQSLKFVSSVPMFGISDSDVFYSSSPTVMYSDRTLLGCDNHYAGFDGDVFCYADINKRGQTVGFEFWCDTPKQNWTRAISVNLVVPYKPYSCTLPTGWVYINKRVMTAYFCSRPTPAPHNNTKSVYIDTDGSMVYPQNINK